jgi:hypothetical protein
MKLAIAPVLAVLVIGATRDSRPATAAPSKFLPDSTVVLRVGKRITRADDFVEQYWTAWAPDRPAPDSTGKREFLEQVLDKEVMATVALQNPRPLDYGDRLVLRQHSERILSNVLYQRTVLDSSEVTPAMIAELRKNYALEKHLERILFENLSQANRVREDLLAKKVAWEAAGKSARQELTDPKGGDLGWIPRNALSHVDAAEVFDLKPGEISQPYRDDDGVSLVRVVGQRPTEPPNFARFDKVLRAEIRSSAQGVRMDDIHRRLSLRLGLTFDEPNIRWTASQFPIPRQEMATLQIGVGKIPTFAPEDTGRVLARWDGGHMTIHDFMYRYMQTHPYLRQPANTPVTLSLQVEAFALEPYRALLAQERGLDKDPLAMRLIEHRREAILVEHLYEDSIQAHVRTTEAQERKFYQANIARFITYANVNFAAFSRPTKESADSLANQLRAGLNIQVAIAADSVRFGKSTGFTSHYTSEAQGQPFYELLMQELKPGQVGIEHTDRGWWAIKSLDFDPGHQLSFDEARVAIQESVSNIAAQDLLDRFLARHKRGLKIEKHSEVLDRIDFSDPESRN